MASGPPAPITKEGKDMDMVMRILFIIFISIMAFGTFYMVYVVIREDRRLLKQRKDEGDI